MKEEKRRIIRKKAGELAHIDCHHLSKDLVADESRRRYLVCVIDSYSRVDLPPVQELRRAAPSVPPSSIPQRCRRRHAREVTGSGVRLILVGERHPGTRHRARPTQRTTHDP